VSFSEEAELGDVSAVPGPVLARDTLAQGVLRDGQEGSGLVDR